MVAILTNDFMFVILGAEVCVDEKFCTDHVFPHIMCLRGVVFTLVAFSLILRCHTVSILDPINYLGPPAEVCVGGKCCHRALAMCHLIPHNIFLHLSEITYQFIERIPTLTEFTDDFVILDILDPTPRFTWAESVATVHSPSAI